MGTRQITYIDPTTGLPTTIEAEATDLFGSGLIGARPASGDFVGDLWLLDTGSGVNFILQRWDGSSWGDITTAPSSGGSIDNRVVRWDGTGGNQLQNSGVTLDDNDKMTIPSANGNVGLEIGTGTNPLQFGLNSGGTAFFRRPGGAGAIAWMDNASNPQWLMGDGTTDGGSFFIDTDSLTTGNREIALNTLGGAGAGAAVRVGTGGFKPDTDASTPLGVVAQRFQRGHIMHMVTGVLVVSGTSNLDDETFVVAQAGTYTVTLPTAAAGWTYVIERQGSTGTVTLAPNTGDTINGGGSTTLDATTTYMIVAQDATDWRLINLTAGAGGGGDNITVNGVAATDADFDNATPAAPAGGVNVKWQKDTAAPDNISAHLAADDVSNTVLANMPANTVKVNNTAGTADPVDLTIGVNNVLGRAGGNIVSTQVVTAQIANDAVTNVKLANMAANTIKANATGATADPADLAPGVNTVVGRAAGNLVAAQLVTAQCADNAIDNTKIADMTQATVKGRAAGSGTGDPVDLNSVQLTVLVELFTSTLSGAVPGSGGGTTNFLRADGTWAAPAGGGDVVGPASATDNAIVRFDLTTGKLIQNSGWLISDTNVMSQGTAITIDPSFGGGAGAAVNLVGSTSAHALRIENTAVSGELISLINSLGNSCGQWNKDGSGNGILRVTTNAGVNTFEHVAGGGTSIGPVNGISSAWPLTVRGAATGNGLRIHAGEVDGDIALRISDQDSSFGGTGGAIMEIDADSGEITLFKSLAQTQTDRAIRYGIDQQNSIGTPNSDFNTQFGNYRIAGALANGAMGAYDSVGGQTFTTTPITVAIDTLQTDTGAAGGNNTALFTHSAAADTITVNVAGTYLVIGTVGTDVSTGSSRSSSQGWIENNTVEIAGTRMNMYNRLAGNGLATGTAAVIITLAATDALRLRVVRTVGSDTLTTVVNASRLLVVRLSI